MTSQHMNVHDNIHSSHMQQQTHTAQQQQLLLPRVGLQYLIDGDQEDTVAECACTLRAYGRS